MNIYNVYQSGKRLYIDEKENPDNKIACNKYESEQTTLRLISDGTLPPRLYWALRNPKLSQKYFILKLVNNEDLIVGTDISATPGLWDMLLIGTDEDYIIEGADIDQSRLTYVSDHFGRLFVRDNFLEELDFEEQCSPTFKIFYDEIMFRLDGVVTDEDIQEMNDKIDDTLEFSKNASEKADEALSLAKGATKPFVYDTYSDMISELNQLDKAELLVNYHIMIREVCVPDLWISGVSDEHVEYTYTSNEDFIVDLTEDGVVQVGYFVLSALETQKVDLSEYVKKTDYASNTKAGVVLAHGIYGITTNPDGLMYILTPSQQEITDKSSTYKPITPSNLDYAVMKALSDSKIEWTNEQKQRARTILGITESYENNNNNSGSNYPQKVFEYEWKDNYDQIDVTSIDYETGILTVSSMPTQITDDVSTTVRVFPSLKIEGVAEQFKYGMMPKEIMETNIHYYAKKVGDNHVILCNTANSTELATITNSDVVDLTRWNLFVEKKRNSAIPNVEVKNLDKTHRYKLRYYIPHVTHHTSSITVFTKSNGSSYSDRYGSEYGFGYKSTDVHLNETNNNSSMFILNSYETVSLRSKHHEYNEHVMTKYPRFFEVDIYKLSDKAYNADVNIGYFAPFTSPKDNTVFCMSTVKQNIFLQRPYEYITFNGGNGKYILDGARCEVWDYGEVL